MPRSLPRCSRPPTRWVFSRTVPNCCVATCGDSAAAEFAPRARRDIMSDGPAWAIVDGQSGIGMVTSVFAMNVAIEKARTAGMAYVGVRNSCHFGAAGYYANLASRPT